MDYKPPGRVHNGSAEEAVSPAGSSVTGRGRYWAGAGTLERLARRSQFLFLPPEVDAMEARNRRCLGGDVADTFSVMVVVAVGGGRWSKRELARHLEKHRRFCIGGKAGRRGTHVVGDHARAR